MNTLFSLSHNRSVSWFSYLKIPEPAPFMSIELAMGILGPIRGVTRGWVDGMISPDCCTLLSSPVKRKALTLLRFIQLVVIAMLSNTGVLPY